MKLPRLHLLVITDKRRWEREVTPGALLFLALVAMGLLVLLAKVAG